MLHNEIQKRSCNIIILNYELLCSNLEEIWSVNICPWKHKHHEKVPSIWISVIIINLFTCTDPHMQLRWPQDMLPAASSICTNKEIVGGLHYACWEKQWNKSHMPAFWWRRPVRGKEKNDRACLMVVSTVLTQTHREDINSLQSIGMSKAGRKM